MSIDGIFAQASASEVYYQFSRAHAMTEWWHWVTLGSVLAVIGFYVIWMYRRDSVELPKLTSMLLAGLRLLAFGGILFFFLDLEKRTQQRIEKPSRVAVLVDTSQSMAVADRIAGATPGPSRMEHVIRLFDGDTFLTGIRAEHEVVVYRFDEKEQPTLVGSFSRTKRAEADTTSTVGRSLDAARQARVLAGIAGGLGVAALISLFAFRIVLRRRTEAAATAGGEPPSDWGRLVATVLIFAGLVVFAVSTLLDPELSLSQIVGLQELEHSKQQTKTNGEAGDRQPEESDVAWQDELIPRGRSTRIGDAVRSVLRRHRGEPLAGVVLLTDGAQNEGLGIATAITLARDAGVPVYPIGIGSDRKPVNVRVVDLEAPLRVFPGDPFSLTGYVQAFGMEGRTVKVSLVSTEEGNMNPESEILEEERRVTLEADGQVISMEFKLVPEQAGTRLYRLRVDPPREDLNSEDDQQGSTVHIVERRNRVLLLAGGPTREYRFLRNQLYRDEEIELHVILQSAPDGVSQDADKLLDDLPSTADEFFEYDAIVAFDPDWLAFDENQLGLLERWVAEQAGGLVVVAGPIYTPEWSALRRGRDRRADLVRSLYPVEFYSQGAPTLSLGRFGGEDPWPLEFTRDGTQAEFLRLEDDELGSEEAWSSFAGVFGYYAVRDPKPGARIYARFSDPETAIDEELPIYLASHMYGAGRVFFQASGEMWRLRSIEEEYYERYYTKLIRWVSQGRLLRDSSRGVLLIDKDRAQVGDQVEVRAILTDAQHQPLVRESVEAVLVFPGGRREPIELPQVQNASREGTFALAITLLQEGDYTLELTPPEGTEADLLSKVIQVRSTDREIAAPQRQDAVLTELADKTGGVYFIGTDSATGVAGDAPVMTMIPSADQITYVSGAPDSRFDQRLMLWLMVIVSGLLFVEWTIRRLSKLA